MSTLGTRNPTYRDVLSGLRKDQSRDADIVELFVEENPILDDIVVTEANEGTSNLTTIRAGLPTPAWTGLYEGPQPSKGSKKQVKDASGTVESLLEIATKLYDIAPDREAFMLDEAKTHVEAMGQEVAGTIVYGDIASDPKTFNGLVKRYPNISNGEDSDESPFYVLDGSKTAISTAALRSIWLIGHGTKAVSCFYPKGTRGGIVRNPVEDVWSEDVTNGKYKVKRQLFQWHVGLTVRDFRYAGRIANIESDAMFASSGQPDYLELVRRLHIRVRNGGVRQTWYMDRLTFEMLNVCASRKTQNNAIRSDTLFERPVQTLYGIPVRILDALEVNETEAVVAS